MDRYTKAVLTVIAGALVVLIIQNGMSHSRAQGAADACGSSPSQACYVTTGPREPLFVSNVPGWAIDVKAK